MSFYTLPSVRMPKATAAADCIINSSLSDYLAQLQEHPSQYERLGELCECKEKGPFFKFMELLSVVPLPQTPFKTMCLGTACAPRGIEVVATAAPKTVDLLISDADFGETLATACLLQALGGTLVVDVRRLSSQAHVRLVYVMAALYKSVSVYSPVLYCGDEKYLIGREFKGGDMPSAEFPMSLYFLTKLEEINSVIGQTQMDHIRSECKADQGCAEWRAAYFTSS